MGEVEPQPCPPNHGALPFNYMVEHLFNPLALASRRRTTLSKGGPSPHELKRIYLQKFIAHWRKHVGQDIFPAFRLLMPDRDRERSMYKIKETSLAKLFIKILGLSPQSEDAQSIEKWKVPGVSSRASAGDFPGRLEEVVLKRAARTEPGSLTVQDVNERLDRLSESSKDAQQKPILIDFYEHMNTAELKWLCCIVLRVMKIGVTERTVFEIWHADAYKLWSKSSSLLRVCHELWDPSYRLPDADKDVAIFSCFQPQLANFKKKDLPDVLKAIPTRPFWIEEKIDGERIQLHKEGDAFRYFSRRATDYTYLYGADYDGGALTKHLKHAFIDGVHSVILDGEMIAWSPAMQAPMPFGSVKSAANNEKADATTSLSSHPYFIVYDILHLNGKNLTTSTLRARRQVLTKIIQPIDRRLEVIAHEEGHTAAQIEARLRRCVDEASEGLVVKDPASAYATNKRTDGWIKVKPEYMGEFGENLDLLVIGGFYGEGRRGNMVASFLCGIRQDSQQPSRTSQASQMQPSSPSKADDEETPRYTTFCRVGGGFNAADYAEIKHLTAGKWVKFNPRSPPPHIFCARSSSGTIIDPPDVWIRPQDSFVVQLKAASITPSDTFGMGLTLRFPRFERLRPDKDYMTAVSKADLHDIKRQAERDHANKLMTTHKRRATGPASGSRKRRALIVQGGELLSDDDNSSGPLAGHDFYIMTSSKAFKKSKLDLEHLVREAGGRVVQRDDPDVNCVAEGNTVKVAALKKRGTHDIHTIAWLVALCQRDGAFDNLPQSALRRIDKARAKDITREFSGEIFPLLECYEHLTDDTRRRILRHISLRSKLSANDLHDDDEMLSHALAICSYLSREYRPPTLLERAMAATTHLAPTDFGRPLQDDEANETAIDDLDASLQQLTATDTDLSPMHLFSQCRAVFFYSEGELPQALFTVRGGQLVDASIDHLGGASVTHIVIGQDNNNDDNSIDPQQHQRALAQQIRTKLSGRPRRLSVTRLPHIVTTDWVSECSIARTLLAESRFRIT
ncbi:DNA ligase (ATP) [Savitreella phatthalungensis]